jgi:predicted nucleic acid-binding protein
MYLVDTNVVSELRRPERADTNVVAWASTVPAASFFLSVISILEIELGALQIARRDAAQGAVLRAWIDDQILPRFDGRILAMTPPWRSVVRIFTCPIHAPSVMP